MGRRELRSHREYSGRERRMSTDKRKRWKPLDSGSAISASPAAAGLPCHRPALASRPAARPRARGRCTAGRLPQPRAGPADPPRRGVGAEAGPEHGEGRAAPLPLRTQARPRKRCRFPAGRRCERRGAPAGGAAPSRPVPPRSGARRGRGAPARELCSLAPGGSVGGGAGRGRCGRKGKCRAPAPTQPHHPPTALRLRGGNLRICLQTCPPPTERKTQAFKVLTLIKARLVKDFTQCGKKFDRA